jgi:2,3-diketo-5-methylthiopentyl-1-phosphate enolase
VRATYELDPPEWAETLATLESTSLPDGPAAVRARVVGSDRNRVTIDFPALDEPVGVTVLVSSVLAGEWADRGDFRRCRLVHVEWPDWLPGPRFAAPDRVLVGAIVKPALGLTPAEFASTAAALARGGADLVKDDELLTDPSGCPLDKRVRAVAAEIGDATLYAPNVTGPTESLLARAEATVRAGATALMLNVFAQGLDSLRALRDADFGVPLFAHRVGGAFLTRGNSVSVEPRVLAELTRLCGADFVQVGSFTDRVHDSAGDVRAQLEGCHAPLGGAQASVAVIGGGIGPDNARDQLAQAGWNRGVMLLLGSAAYLDPGGLEGAVARACHSLREPVAVKKP